jgi:hypothetical protein
MEDMKTWPIGRTYVFGVGFTDGPRTVQQPFFKKEGVITVAKPPMDNKAVSVSTMIAETSTVSHRINDALTEMIHRIGRMRSKGMSDREIAFHEEATLEKFGPLSAS